MQTPKSPTPIMAPRKSASPSSIYQLKITLKGIRPPIWRRVQIPSNITLGQLHWIIQSAMGWTNSHLHSFTIDEVEYGMVIPELGFDDEIEVHDENRANLDRLIPGEKFKFPYLYDFGDSWEHEILVEKVLPIDSTKNYPTCLKAQRACPPEDCGGTWGYAEFCEIIQTPDHEDHESMLEWIGGSYDPEAADLHEINLRLAQTWSQVGNARR
jgi:hypothetical protein